eukprot:CAMPEP_0179128718 /NCGR_PEP_ID=MMETSP0796-20121207/61043_1 /TAXON_ID=73915 /ORGANISM="Pyrodinium bahamense, Strain pbaha01" /LENGTH=322 /DNA_ID=CAMNT_0020827575 /DNA_START=14 /DNA_END=982 /DNA_ORIENTATION=-
MGLMADVAFAVAAGLGVLQGAVPAAAAPVSLEVYYGSKCPRSRAFIQQALLPLVNAGLPGDQVQLTFLPMPYGTLTAGVPYQPGIGDYFSVNELCILRPTMPQPALINSPALVSAVKYVACDLDHTLDGTYSQASQRTCAEVAGVPYGPLQACVDGDAGSSIMFGREYTSKVASAHQRHVTPAPSLFLNGRPLLCVNPLICTGFWTPAGEEPLAQQGTLLATVCSMLSPPPPQCTQAASVPLQLKVEEVGPLRLPRAAPRGAAAASAGLAMLGLVNAGALGVLAWQRGRRGGSGAAAASELRRRAGEHASLGEKAALLSAEL